MQIRRLREETEKDHRAVEESLSLMSDGLTHNEYLATLERMYGIVSAWEHFAEEVATPDLLPFVRIRARSSLLETDILALYGRLDSPPAPFPHLTSRSELLGALYVMEGSRLGGQLIARHVEAKLGFENGFVRPISGASARRPALTGSGMTAKHQQQLFQPFFSTKGDLGNGLGLYISHEIIERHGGHLHVISAPSQGTQMRVFLPDLEPVVQ